MATSFLAKHFVSIRSGLSMKRGAQALVRGDGAEAVFYFKEAVSAKTEILKGNRNATVAQAMIQLASAYKLSGDEMTATNTLTEALDILQEKSPSDPDIYIHMNNLGVLLRNTGQHAEASGVFNEALRLTSMKEESGDVSKTDFDTMKITTIKNELIYAKSIHENTSTSSSTSMKPLLRAKSLLNEIIKSRETPIDRVNFHKEHYGLMHEELDPLLGYAVGLLGEIYYMKYLFNSHIDNHNEESNENENENKDENENENDEDEIGSVPMSRNELLDFSLNKIKESINILNSSIKYDEDNEKANEIQRLNEMESEIMKIKLNETTASEHSFEK